MTDTALHTSIYMKLAMLQRENEFWSRELGEYEDDRWYKAMCQGHLAQIAERADELYEILGVRQ